MGFSFCMSSCQFLPEEVHTENGTYKRYDFDPYSPTRNPNHGQLLGFYIDKYKYIEHNARNAYGAGTYVCVGEATVENGNYLLVYAGITGPSEPIGIASAWLSLPYDNIVVGQEYSCLLPGNELEIYTKDGKYLGDYFVDEPYTVYPDMVSRYVPVSDITVVYEKNTNSVIQGRFTAEFELNLENGIRTITLDNGLFRFLRNHDGYITGYSYERWMKENRNWGM